MSASPSLARPGLSGGALKAIAAVTMFLDHIGAAILESPVLWEALSNTDEIDAFFNSPALAGVRAANWVLRLVGRLAFPIFCFLLVEGFLHTRSVKSYALRLGAFALLSELPFDLAFGGTLWNPGYQNVFFTLLLGLGGMAALRRFGESSPLGFLMALGCAALAQLIHADYGAFGVVLILIFYLFRDRKKLRALVGSIALIWEVTAPLAFLFIHRYNGERGRLGGRYFFYWFYPAHILVLWLVRVMLLGS